MKKDVAMKVYNEFIKDFKVINCDSVDIFQADSGLILETSIRSQDAYKFHGGDDYDGVFKEKQVKNTIRKAMDKCGVAGIIELADAEKWWFNIKITMVSK